MNRCRGCGCKCNCNEFMSSQSYLDGDGEYSYEENQSPPRPFLEHLHGIEDERWKENRSGLECGDSPRVNRHQKTEGTKSGRGLKYGHSAQPPQSASTRRPRYFQESFLERERRYRETPTEVVNRREPESESDYNLEWHRGHGDSTRHAKAYRPVPDLRSGRPSHPHQNRRNLKRRDVPKNGPKFLESPTPFFPREPERGAAGLEGSRIHSRRAREEIYTGKLSPPPPAFKREGFEASNLGHESGTKSSRHPPYEAKGRGKQNSPQRRLNKEFGPNAPVEADERYVKVERAMSSMTILHQNKPVQRMRQEWEERMKRFNETSSAEGTNRPISKSPKRFITKVEKSIHVQEIESDPLPNRSSPERALEMVTGNTNIDVEDTEEPSESVRPQLQAQRDSYIDSEDMKRLLRDSSPDALNPSPKYPGQSNDEFPTNDKSPDPKVFGVRPYVEKWKAYHRARSQMPIVSEKSPPTNGLTLLEFHSALVRTEKVEDATIKHNEERSLTPPPPPSPPKTWWQYLTGQWSAPADPELKDEEDLKETNGFKSFPSSISGSSRVSYAIGIGDNLSNRTYRKNPTDELLKPLNEDFDHTVKITGKPMTLELKESRLRTNLPFELMKSASQAHVLSRKSKMSLAQAHSSASQQRISDYCHGCNEKIDLKDDTLDIITARGYYWHSQCFQCSTCKIVLNENNHFWRDNHLFCIAHYAQKVNAPKCAVCNQYIFETVYTQARGKTYHKQHFRCNSCNQAIVDTKFVTRKGEEVVCFECYEKYYSHICGACGKRILPTEEFVFLKSAGSYWHGTDACLQCGTCHQSLVDQSRSRLIFVKNGVPYCNNFCAQRSSRSIS